MPSLHDNFPALVLEGRSQMECPKCGAHNAEGATACEECGSELGELIGPDGQPAGQMLVAGYGLASLWRRLGAVILDSLLLSAAGVLFLVWAAYRWNGPQPDGHLRVTGTPLLATTVGLAVLNLLYVWIMEALFGATLGKAFVGVQVRRLTGEGPGFKSAFLRTIGRLFDFLPAFYLLGWLFAVLSRRRQRIGDRMAGTVVILRESILFAVAGVIFYLGALAVIGWRFYRQYRTMHSISVSIVTGAGGAIETGARGGQSGSATLPTEQSGKLKLQNFTFVESNGGATRTTSLYKPGDDVSARYEITGYGTGPDGKIAVALRVTCTDPNGLTLDHPWENMVTGEPKGAGTPIRASYQIHLPPFAPSGIYKLNIHAQDNVGNSVGDFAPAFTVENPSPVLATMKLEVRDFHFMRAKEGEPISPVEYHAGESVYYNFRLLGMQFRDDHVNLHIAYKLVGPDGNVLLNKPDWESLNDAFAYHPPNFFLVVNGYLDLPAEIKPGTYTLVYQIADNNGNSSLTHESTFEVK
jgi:uncharacterized RDD family membrane protein YckC